MSSLGAFRRKPDFICIGAAKAGTTWLYEQLRRHPQLWLPHVKELHYFDQPETLRFGQLLFQRSVFGHVMRKALLQGLLPGRVGFTLRYLLGRRSVASYHKLFATAGARLAGEITPAYARLPEEIIAEIAASYPDIKIIYILRNPVDRIWSHLNMVQKRKIVAFDAAGMLKRMNHRHRDSSLYLANLANWEKHFPPEQVFIGFYDELSAEPVQFLNRILGFLGIESGQVAEARLAKRENTGVYRDFPAEAKKQLYQEWEGEIRALHARFANHYTTRWLEEAEEALKAKSL